MRRKRIVWCFAWAIAGMLMLGSCAHKKCVQRDFSELKAELAKYVEGKDARIGVAVIIDREDTVAISGNQSFPMLSSYKFPQALAVADFCQRTGVAFCDTVDIAAAQLRVGTWSPMREIYGVRNLSLPLHELLAFSLQQSDNNACDILFDLTGGTSMADSVMNAWGYADINILFTEDEMHRDTGLCYENSATPVEMARMLDCFSHEMKSRGGEYAAVAALMETCATGTDRLAKPLSEVEGVVLGHKTGTGDRNAQGRIIAVNDVGYVELPNGHCYAIAVFVCDSAYDMDESSAIIAGISNAVYNAVSSL